MALRNPYIFSHSIDISSGWYDVCEIYPTDFFCPGNKVK